MSASLVSVFFFSVAQVLVGLLCNFVNVLFFPTWAGVTYFNNNNNNTRQDFLKIPRLCEAALETERRCFSKVIFESNVTPKITRSSDSFSTVLKIVNGGDWGCIVRDLETIIILVLLAFNFIPQRSHYSLTLPRSRIRDSATATLTPGDGITAIKV